jgi:hypothetical protein
MATTDKSRTDSSNIATGDRNPDPITGAPGSHPVGTGIGAGSGAVTGAALGALGGPIGMAIGTIAGGYMGKGLGEANDPTDPRARAEYDAEDDSYWRDQYKSRSYATADTDYGRDVSPAYRFGSAIGSNWSQTPSPAEEGKPGLGERIGSAVSNAVGVKDDTGSTPTDYRRF